MPRWTQFELEQHMRKVGKVHNDRPSPSRGQVLEAEIHDEIASHCRSLGWMVVHSRMDMPTTQAPGIPDFIVAQPDGRTVWAEVKRPGSKPTTDQLGTIAWLRKLGHRAGVVYSLDEFKDLCR